MPKKSALAKKPAPAKSKSADFAATFKQLKAILAEGAGVKFQARCRARALETAADGAAITAVSFERDGGESERLECDLVVDASGRAAPTLALLERLGRPAPEQTTIGVDFAYTTQVFEPPTAARSIIRAKPLDGQVRVQEKGPPGGDPSL